jgi:hypothetical protein
MKTLCSHSSFSRSGERLYIKKFIPESYGAHSHSLTIGWNIVLIMDSYINYQPIQAKEERGQTGQGTDTVQKVGILYLQ